MLRSQKSPAELWTHVYGEQPLGGECGIPVKGHRLELCQYTPWTAVQGVCGGVSPETSVGWSGAVSVILHTWLCGMSRFSRFSVARHLDPHGRYEELPTPLVAVLPKI